MPKFSEDAQVPVASPSCRRSLRGRSPCGPATSCFRWGRGMEGPVLILYISISLYIYICKYVSGSIPAILYLRVVLIVAMIFSMLIGWPPWALHYTALLVQNRFEVLWMLRARVCGELLKVGLESTQKIQGPPEEHGNVGTPWLGPCYLHQPYTGNKCCNLVRG